MTVIQRLIPPTLAVGMTLAMIPAMGAMPTAHSGRAVDRSAPAASADPVRRPAATPPPVGRSAERANRVCVREGGRVVCRRYATFYRYFSAGRYPTGVGATFSVHNPRQLRGNSSHSLAEISLHKPGALRTMIEVGWRRAPGDRRPRLFVFRWNRNNPSCYNRCGGFKVRGPGKPPGAALRPGSAVRVEWRHHHRRWNLYVNGKWSGFYPDRLFNGTFRRVRLTQLFGEIAFSRSGVGRCVDMGNGGFPRHRSARVFKIRYLNTSAGYRSGGRVVTAPRLYNLQRTSPRSFKYGGPGPC